MTPNWIGYARTGKEQQVEADICDMGITALVPVKVEALRRGKRRYAEAVITPALPNYILISATPHQWHKLRTVKHLARTMLAVSAADGASLARWASATAADYAARMAMIEAGQRLEEYNPGDMIRITAGPFTDQLARFRRLVEAGPGSEWAQVEAEVEAFGRVARVLVDPLRAKRA